MRWERFLLCGLIVPGAGEGHVHGDAGADRACAEEERGVTGDNFCVGECADIAHFCLVSGELAVCDHLIELEAGSDTGQITALIDGSEGVVVVSQLLSMSAGAGGVAELHLGMLLGGVDHVRLMTEAVGEDDVAAVFGKLCSCVVALLIFGDVLLEYILDAEVLACSLCRIHEVEVVGGVLIVQEYESDLYLGFVAVIVLILVLVAVAAGTQRKYHGQCQKQCSNLLHHLSVTLQKILLSSSYEL